MTPQELVNEFLALTVGTAGKFVQATAAFLPILSLYPTGTATGQQTTYIPGVGFGTPQVNSFQLQNAPNRNQVYPGLYGTIPGSSQLYPTQSNTGTSQLNPGTYQLNSGISQLYPGTSQVYPGTSQLYPGTPQFYPGIPGTNASSSMQIDVRKGGRRKRNLDYRKDYVKVRSSLCVKGGVASKFVC